MVKLGEGVFFIMQGGLGGGFAGSGDLVAGWAVGDGLCGVFKKRFFKEN